MPDLFVGGCLCGAVRYDAGTRVPDNVAHCHCQTCRRASGAPLVTWAVFPLRDFRFTRGTPAEFASSASGRRSFCAACGTPLTLVDTRRPDEIDVTVASLDRAGEVRANRHCWAPRRLPWLVVDEHLPQHREGSPS